MSYPPFNAWMLDETPLSAEQESALKAHLAACPDCQQTQASWQSARLALRIARLASPAPGFSRRFQASLAERRARQAHQREVLGWIGGLSLGVVAAAGLLAVLIFSASTPVDLLVRGTDIVAGVISFWNRAQPIFLGIIQHPLVMVVWVLLSSGVCLLALGWLFTLWRISFQGAEQK